MSKTITVTITGAAGQIGYQLLFRLASGQVFGPETCLRLRLLEVEVALPSLEGVVMELQDCAFPLLKEVITTSDANVAFKGTNWAILVGAAPRKAGMERSDLLRINGGIFKTQGRAINDNADDDVRVFVVGNPCNTNALIAMHHAPDVPNNRFYAMTMLDQHRASMQLAIKSNRDVVDVKKMVIWGNHSSTQYPDFYHAEIGGKPATEVITDLPWLNDQFIPMIQQRGAAVIKARGASSAGSAANAALDSVRCLVNTTAKDDYFSVASVSEGQYGVDKGLIFSFPSRVENGQFKVIDTLQHNAFGQQKLQLTLDELRHERDAVKELGLIN